MSPFGATEMLGTTETAQPPFVYLDANPIIYLFEGEATVSEPVALLFEALRRQPGLAATSELSLAEVLAPTKRRGKISDQLKRAYLNLLVWSRVVHLEPVSRPILYETADVRLVAPKLKLPDSIHLVTAIRLRCRFFVTRDAGISMPQTMVRITPDQSGIGRVLEALG